MASVVPRRRASTLKAPESEVWELKTRLDVLQSPEKEDITPEENVHRQIEACHRIRQSLLEDKDQRRVKDAFRHSGGFRTVLSRLKKSGTLSAPLQANLSLDLLKSLLQLLSAALQEHTGNQRYFRDRVEGGGWSLLQTILSDIIKSFCLRKETNSSNTVDRILGCLMSCALNDDSISELPNVIRRRCSSLGIESPDQLAGLHLSPGDHHHEEILRSSYEKGIEDILSKELNSSTRIFHPEPLLVALRLWKDLQLPSTLNEQGQSKATFGILQVVSHIAKTSTHNAAVLHAAGALGALLPCLVGPVVLSPIDGLQLRSLCQILFKSGISSLDEASFLYHHARSSACIQDLLLSALKASRTPSYIHFDLSLSGYSSVELPGLGHNFPPAGSSTGYTLSLWFQIIHFDPKSHTTLFGAFDASQTCFVLVYVEKDTHNLILQTSVTSSRPSVRFKSVVFQENEWYHVVVTHQRPKINSSSRASLFVNGEFTEQVKSQYPAIPPASNGKDVVGGPKSESQSFQATQAFLGSPQDLATGMGSGLVTTQWRLSSSHLFATVLNDDLIAVYNQLGPRYTGNFQDCLGSFQTYSASAALNLRNESLHPGKEESSDIIAAIRSKAGLLLSEREVLLSISATVVLDDIDTDNAKNSEIVKCLSKPASRTLRNITLGGRNALAINGAIPLINDALLQPPGFAILTGSTSIVVPGPLDDAAWRLAGGSNLGLALLEAAERPKDVLRALKITLEIVHENWRNSEAMERDNGFGALAFLLGSKLERSGQDHGASRTEPSTLLPTSQTKSNLESAALTIILEFVGYCANNPEESVINNPLAYRILLVDSGMWRKCPASVQAQYFQQFVDFATRSKYRQFNLKRLLRMRETFESCDEKPADSNC